MQRDEAALAEFRAPDHEAIGREVIQPEVDGLGDAQPGGREQGKERAVRVAPQGPVSRARRRQDQLTDLIR